MAIVTGTSGDDNGAFALVGTSATDVINGLAGDDEIYAGASNDILVGGVGSDVINGGSGFDLLSYDYAASSVVVDLSQGYGFVDLTDSDQLFSVENVWGSKFGDILVGDEGANELFGRTGNDLLAGRGGADRLSGGDGFDTASYALSDAAVQVNLATGATSGGHAQGDFLSDIENLVGSNYNDTLVGNGGSNRLHGGGGGDTLRGGAGADTVSGDEGKDALWGGKDADVFAFEVGDSAATKANADVIKDYSEAQGDRIDLSAFGGLDFIGGDAFSAANQARVTTSGGNTFVAINLTGADTAEMFIRLDGLHTLEQNDFLL